MSLNKKQNVMSKPADVPKSSAAPKIKVSDWAKMLVNPGEAKTVHGPVTAPFTGDSLAFTRTLEFDASSFPDGNFNMTLRPALEYTLSINNGEGITFTPGCMCSDSSGTVMPPSISFAQGYFPLSFTGLVQDQNGSLLGVASTTAQPNGMYAFEWGLAGTYLLKVSGTCVQAKFIYRLDDVWTVGNVIPIGGLNPPNCDAWGVIVQSPGITRGFSMVLTQSAGPASTVASPSVYNAFSTHAVDLSGVEQYRVAALSALVSYTGNQFNNGGVIAAARVRPGYAYPTAPFESLTQLVDHSYNGPLKDGAYVWWRPSSVSEFDFLGPHDRPAGTTLRVAGKFADPNGSIKVTLRMVVEFYSRLQIFSRDVFPPMIDDYNIEFVRLECLPAATCNPSHSEIFRRLVKGAAQAAKSGAQYAMANPELIKTMLNMFA